ncbi:AAA family ATPase [Legionella waltersii]|uniref:ATPase n=1 Tax=Legionella waltersii TaxID=66969 RepID=A0A0W1AE63_9GAMM|nr:AAA family ATPase [Legionella waltersii]KTD79443.1 ATPase [Legionella waltersii]SNU97622.1 ATPase [Legionella waltersii]
MKTNFFILTGGPGTGKTSVLTSLSQKGYLTVPEVARDIIKEQHSMGGDALHTGDRDAFLELMLRHSLSDYKMMQTQQDVVFFDRGMPDLAAYAKAFCHKEHQQVNQAVIQYRYNQKVFMFPPWKTIYTNDSERRQDFAESVDTYNALKEAYQQWGYTLIDVPFLDVEDRVSFILKTITP